MALTPLREALSVSNEGFQQKLNTLSQTAQSYKAGELAKQRMAQELQQQKDLVQFKSDVELQQQKDYYEEITRPQEEAEQQAEYIEGLRESFTDAQETVKEFANRESQSKYQNVTKYNLGNFEYNVEPVTGEDGQIQNYQPSINFQGQQMEYQDFTDTLSNLKDFGDFLDQIQNSELGPSRKETQEVNGQQMGVSYVGGDQVDDYITQVKTDPEFRYQEYAKYKMGLVRPSEPLEEEDGGISGGKTPQTKSIPLVGRLKESLGNNTSKTYTFNEDVSSFFGGDVAASATVDFTSSISGVKEQLDRAIRQGILPEESEFSLSGFTPEQRQLLVAGNMTDEQIDTLPENLQDDADTITNFTGETKQKLNEIVQYYNYYDGFYNEYAEVSRQAMAPDEIFLDLWNAPEDLTGLDVYKKLTRPISEVQNRSKLLQFGQNLRRKADVTARWMGGYGNIGTD